MRDPVRVIGTFTAPFAYQSLIRGTIAVFERNQPLFMEISECICLV